MFVVEEKTEMHQLRGLKPPKAGADRRDAEREGRELLGNDERGKAADQHHLSTHKRRWRGELIGELSRGVLNERVTEPHRRHERARNGGRDGERFHHDREQRRDSEHPGEREQQSGGVQSQLPTSVALKTPGVIVHLSRLRGGRKKHRE